MINIIPLILLASLIYLGLLIRHLIQRRTLEEHFIFTVFFVYLVGVIAVCFFPIPIQHSLLVAMHHQPWHQSYMAWNPIRSLYLIFTRDRLHDIAYSIGGNLILLFPLGILLPLVSPAMKTRKVFIIGIGSSIAIEALQLIMDGLFGYAYRSPGMDQVLLNALGYWVGWKMIRTAAKRVELPTYEWNRTHPIPLENNNPNRSIQTRKDLLR